VLVKSKNHFAGFDRHQPQNGEGPDAARSSLDICCAPFAAQVGGIGKESHVCALGHKFTQQFEAFCSECRCILGYARGVSPWPVQARDEAKPYRVAAKREHDRDCRGCARAASGDATAAPPRRVRNCRRLISNEGLLIQPLTKNRFRGVEISMFLEGDTGAAPTLGNICTRGDRTCVR
jgi:hypothetical protein